MKIATNTAKLLRNVPLPDEIGTVHDNAVIIDMGSGMTRVGFSGDDAPRLVAPTVVGRAADGAVEVLGGAFRERERLAMENVMERGLITNWDAVESIFMHLDGLLGMSKDANTPVLLSEAALVPKEQRERLTQLLLEKVRVPSLYFSSAPVLGLYSSGRTSGMVIEMGHGTCHTAPVYEGFGLFHSILQLDIGGHDLTTWLGGRITERGVTFPPKHESDIWRYVKEMYGTVCPDREGYNAAVAEARRGPGNHVNHILPDGIAVELGEERFTVTEGLFEPSLIGSASARGLHHLAAESVRKCDQDIAALLCGNIVMTGAGSLFKGLPKRLNNEIQDLIATERVRIYAATERESATFVGGSILASLPTFQDMWVTRADYNEFGSPQITTRNCF